MHGESSSTWQQVWREQRGSQALEASGVAVGAALVAVALLLALQLITTPGMQRTLDCAVAIVLGGSGCGGADGSGGGQGTQPSGTAPSTSDVPSGARTAASIGLDVIPVVGEIKGLIEVFTGTDLVTGEDLGWWRFAGLAGLVGLNEIKLLRHGDEVVDLVRRGDDLLDTGGDVGRRADDVIPPCKLGARPTGKVHGLAAPLSGICRVTRNALNDAEYQQAQDVVAYRGGHFEGPPEPNFRGIDGWLDGVPISLKGYGGNSPAGVLTHASSAEREALAAGYSGVEVFIKAKNVSAHRVIDFATSPPGNLAKIPHQGTISTVYINTADGWLRIDATGIDASALQRGP